MLHPRDLGPALEACPPAVLLDLDQGSSEDLRHAAVLANRAGVPVVGRLVGPPSEKHDALLDALAVTLTLDGDDPRTVARDDLDAGLTEILAAAEANPDAAQVLIGVLRAAVGLDVANGLVVESLAYSLLLGGREFARWRADRPARKAVRSAADVVTVERQGDVLCLTLSRPERRNAFSAQLRDELLEALAVARADPAVTVEIRGAGPDFCSGGDLDEFGSATDLVQAHLLRVEHSAGRELHALASRTTAFLHGACIGAGVEVPAFAARVVALADARLQLPELRMGLIPGAGGTVSVTRRIGRWRAAYLALSGQVIDATTARAWGLVDEVRDPSSWTRNGGDELSSSPPPSRDS